MSFDRPFAENRGAGRMLRWEYPFVRWMEASGYDVGYATDVDLQRDPSIVAGRRLIVFVGHPEYWSKEMRATVDGAIAGGTNVAFFSANEMYWRVRLEPGASGRVPGGRLLPRRRARPDGGDRPEPGHDQLAGEAGPAAREP